jgi:hypothetical protein
MNIAPRAMGLLLVLASAAMAEVRTWTFEKPGTNIQAEVAGFTGDAVTLKRVDGKTVSVRISYLSASDRAYLIAERVKQWKQAEIVSFNGAASGSLYRRYAVRGKDVPGEVLISHLPPAVEAILNDRSRQSAQISNLTAQIEAQKGVVHEANAAAPKHAPGKRVPKRVLTAERAQADTASGDLTTLQFNLATLQRSYDESVKKTKDQTVVRMRNTGVVYQRLPVWECLGRGKPPG